MAGAGLTWLVRSIGSQGIVLVKVRKMMITSTRSISCADFFFVTHASIFCAATSAQDILIIFVSRTTV